MNDFFSTSLGGTLFIFVVLLLRLLFKERLPRTAFAALWLAAIFRLLCPVKIPFAASIWGFMEQEAAIDAEPVSISAGTAYSSMQEPVESSLSYMAIVWAVIAVCLLSGVFILYMRSIREGRKAREIQRGVYVCKELVSPRVCGIFRPRILLPEDVSRELLPYILLHERIHIQRLDNLWKLLALIAAAIHWFNPAAWILVVLLGRDLEVSCDEWVLRRLGQEERSCYALSLIDIAERYERRSPLVCGFSRNPLEERIRCIMTRKKSIAAICAAAVMVLGATAVFATDAPVKADADKETKAVSLKQGEDGKLAQKDQKEAATVKEYEAYMAEEMERLKKQVQEGTLSQENYDKCVKEMQKTLKGLKDGTTQVFFITDSEGNITGESVIISNQVELKKDRLEVNVEADASENGAEAKTRIELREVPDESNQGENVEAVDEVEGAANTELASDE